jgi:hypothetical protein
MWTSTKAWTSQHSEQGSSSRQTAVVGAAGAGGAGNGNWIDRRRSTDGGSVSPWEGSWSWPPSWFRPWPWLWDWLGDWP